MPPFWLLKTKKPTPPLYGSQPEYTSGTLSMFGVALVRLRTGTAGVCTRQTHFGPSTYRRIGTTEIPVSASAEGTVRPRLYTGSESLRCCLTDARLRGNCVGTFENNANTFCTASCRASALPFLDLDSSTNCLSGIANCCTFLRVPNRHR